MSKTLRAWIRKATNVVGETLIFCDATVADSAFLLSLRTAPERSCHFDVRQSNEKVWRFHERFGAARQGKAKMDLLNSIGDTEIGATRWRYRKYLPEILAEVFCDEDKKWH